MFRKNLDCNHVNLNRPVILMLFKKPLSTSQPSGLNSGWYVLGKLNNSFGSALAKRIWFIMWTERISFQRSSTTMTANKTKRYWRARTIVHKDITWSRRGKRRYRSYSTRCNGGARCTQITKDPRSRTHVRAPTLLRFATGGGARSTTAGRLERAINTNWRTGPGPTSYQSSGLIYFAFDNRWPRAQSDFNRDARHLLLSRKSSRRRRRDLRRFPLSDARGRDEPCEQSYRLPRHARFTGLSAASAQRHQHDEYDATRPARNKYDNNEYCTSAVHELLLSSSSRPYPVRRTA